MKPAIIHVKHVLLLQVLAACHAKTICIGHSIHLLKNAVVTRDISIQEHRPAQLATIDVKIALAVRKIVALNVQALIQEV